MDTRTEPIRQDIDAIRDSMTEKMEQIESKVRGTVEDTTSTLRQTFDLKYQVGERPWAALGLSVLVGYALGSMGDDDRSPGYTSHKELPYYRSTSEYTQPHMASNSGNGSQTMASSYEPKKPAEPGFLDTISEQFGDELHLLKGAAIASVVGLIRDTLKQSLPGVYQEMERARGTQSQSSTSSSPTYYESIGASEDPNRRTQGPTGTHENESSYRSPYATS